MEEFVLNGHQVYVIGTFDSEKIQKSELSIENGIKVLRIHSGRIRKTSYYRKMISLLALGRKMLKAIERDFKHVKFQLIISPTPPITLSGLYKKLRNKYNAKFYLLLKDIWPQGSVDHNVIHKYGIPWFFLRLHEIRTYNTADFIGCMSPYGVEYILSHNRFISRSKVEVCPNCIRPNKEIPNVIVNELRLKYNIPVDACVFIFSGNLGIGHGLNFLAEAINYLSDYKKAFFIIGGSGTHFQFVRDRLKDVQSKNVFIYNWLPSEDFNKILASSDAGLILLHKYTVPQFPSRLLSYLEYSKPVLCAVNKETDIGKIIEQYGCGRSVIHGDLKEFVTMIKYFSENVIERIKMSKNAHKLLIDNYTVKHAYNIIMSHFNY